MLSPASPKTWNLYSAAHLLNRAAFGGTPDEIQALYKLGRRAAIESLLTVPEKAEAIPEPLLATIPKGTRTNLRDLTNPEERRKLMMQVRQETQAQTRELRSWWVGQMMQPTTAALEKATLFWHGHFATSIQKVRDPGLMAKQNQTLRMHAFGNFGDLVKAMSRDPAMMIWLDLQRSFRGMPNENFARELMELFTLGIGHYTEDDIKESARAFTGYGFNRFTGNFRLANARHDDSPKKFMGETGRFSGDDIIAIILKQSACAEFICGKLWSFYVAEEPPQELVRALANVLRQSNYEVRPVLASLFASEAFNSEKVMRSQIKSPLQLIVQTCRSLQCAPPGAFVLQTTCSALGQIPFAPPNVKGWDGNRHWINTSTLAARIEFTDALVSNRRLLARREAASRPAAADENGMMSPAPMAAEPSASRVDLDKIIPKTIRTEPEKVVDYLVFCLFQTPLSAQERTRFIQFLNESPTKTSAQTLRSLLAQMMKLPEFQLV